MLRPPDPSTPRPRAVAAPLALVLVIGACASDGRDLGDARAPDLGGVVSATTADLPLVQDGPNGMSIASPAFSPGAALPSRFTANGLNLSPPLVFELAPINTTELALVVRDADTDFVHWLVTGIAPSVARWPEGAVTPESIEHDNDAGTTGWAGPDTLEGAKGRLQFELYALGAPLGFTAGADQTDVLAALQAETLGRAAFIGRYGSA
ncbi:MAG: YbhB/YbcL family Raf kinase inhibitor-like protein [Acidimicrobiales bacterium]|nr:YbhB/YbcL family Raf kinase inhibitor-like protein [Acidimicrobiales bacterium]